MESSRLLHKKRTERDANGRGLLAVQPRTQIQLEQQEQANLQPSTRKAQEDFLRWTEALPEDTTYTITLPNGKFYLGIVVETDETSAGDRSEAPWPYRTGGGCRP